MDDREQEFRSREQEIRAREAEIRLRELELEISQQHQSEPEIPQYQTTKHQKSPSSLREFTKKLVKVGKFLGFTVGTLALMRVAFTIGMWLAYGLITAAIAFIAYQIFVGGDD